MPSTFSTILFDLDGTLIDSATDIAAAANHVRIQMNMSPLPVSVIESYVGDGARVLLERTLESREKSLLDHALQIWQPFYEAHCLDHTHLYPGILDVLETLQKAFIPMGIVTNKPLSPTEIILKGLGIRNFFACVVGGDTLPQRKPNPEPLRFAVNQMKQPHENVLVVGDSHNDVLGARNATYASCGVLWGMGDQTQLRRAMPDYIVNNPKDLSALLFL